jgi:hypothetical protein
MFSVLTTVPISESVISGNTAIYLVAGYGSGPGSVSFRGCHFDSFAFASSGAGITTIDCATDGSALAMAPTCVNRTDPHSPSRSPTATATAAASASGVFRATGFDWPSAVSASAPFEASPRAVRRSLSFAESPAAPGPRGMSASDRFAASIPTGWGGGSAGGGGGSAGGLSAAVLAGVGAAVILVVLGSAAAFFLISRLKAARRLKNSSESPPETRADLLTETLVPYSESVNDRQDLF